MRELTIDELNLISGGSDPSEDIVVTGSHYPPSYFPPPFFPPTYYPPSYPPPSGGGGAGPSPAPAIPASFNVGVHHIDTSQLHTPLTADQQKALDQWKSSLARDDAAIANLPNNARVHIDDGSANGRDVMASELKQLWSKTNFTLHDQGFAYANGTTRGESDLNGGSPKISFNVDLIKGYADAAGGTDFLALHELGHLSAAAQAQLQAANADGVWTPAETTLRERIANDTAHAIEAYSGVGFYDEKQYGYSTGSPGFTTPPPTGGGGGRGGKNPIP